MSGILLARTPEDIVACLEAGDPVDSKHPVTGESALLLAAQRCDVEAARLLVQSGADPVGSGALRKAVDLQDFAMARALLKPLPVFDQLCYWRQLVWSCVLTRTAAMLRRWPLYGLPSEVLVAHEMPACDENTLFFCFPDEFGHLKQGIVLAKRALQRGYRVDFMCPERARGKLPEGVRWIPMAGSVQRNTDLRVPLITTAVPASPVPHKPRSEREGWSSGRRPRGQRYCLSASDMVVSLNDAWRIAIMPCLSNSQFSLP